jgi:DNA-damage-inducible protein J
MSVLQNRSNLTISVDRPTREGFAKLCEGLGLSISSCLLAFMRQSVRQQGVSFSLDENGFTPAEVAELKRRIADAEKGHVEKHELIED